MATPPMGMSAIDLAQVMNVFKKQTVATVAAAMVVASGRAHSIQQVLTLMQDVDLAMYPNPSSGFYIEWAKTKDQKLNLVHS
jgi:hypothetical protein